MTSQWIAFDLETNGLVAESDRVVKAGANRCNAAGQELGRFQRLVNPERLMSPASQAMHGITDADFTSATPARAVPPDYLFFIEDERWGALVTHNTTFDDRFLGMELARAGLNRPAHAVFDTLPLARQRIPDLRDHQFDTLARLFNLGVDDRHRALGDCRWVKDLWLTLGGPNEAPDELVSYAIFDPAWPASAPLGWEPVSKAIANGWRLRMEYTGGLRGEAPREIIPRAFINRGGAAYLIAFCHLYAVEKSFRLDRVWRYEIGGERASLGGEGKQEGAA